MHLLLPFANQDGQKSAQDAAENVSSVHSIDKLNEYRKLLWEVGNVCKDHCSLPFRIVRPQKDEKPPLTGMANQELVREQKLVLSNNDSTLVAGGQ